MAGISLVLRSLRETARLTQEELAERAGLSARTVSDIERGVRRRLYADTAERLAAALALTDEERVDFLACARGSRESMAELDSGFRRRFMDWYVARVEQVAADVGNEERWYAVLDSDEPNLVVALRWAEEAGDAETLLRLAGGLWQYWQARGSFATGREWLRRGLDATPPASPERRARALWGMGWLSYQQGDDQAAAAAAAELAELAGAAGDDPVALRNAATLAGMVALATDRTEDALRELGSALALAREPDRPWLLATSLLNLGIASIAAGDVERARELLVAALGCYRDLGDERFAARCLGYLGLAALVDGDAGRAGALFAQSLATFVAVAEPSGTAEGLTGLAAVAAASGEPERAAELAGAAERLRESISGRSLPVERRISQANLDAARRLLPPERWDAAWTRGRAMRVDDAVGIAAAVTRDER
jgi:transcriptional regulator with XRE-family HTH domain